MSKTSHAFAAYRREKIQEFQHHINTDLLPKFKAEANDIDHQFEATLNDAEEQPENAKVVLIRLAMAKRDAARLDLVERKKSAIRDLRNQFMESLKTRVVEYNGGIEGTTVTFPDASQAQMPKTLYVDHSAFKQW